jgi:hypothetical protein
VLFPEIFPRVRSSEVLGGILANAEMLRTQDSRVNDVNTMRIRRVQAFTNRGKCNRLCPYEPSNKPANFG